jgi:UDPglucose 6-dehydrogenase
MNITIAGYGFVGQAHYAALKDKFNVNIYDPALGHTDFGKPEGVIVCVSTPQSDTGACYADNVIDVVGRVDQDTPILVRSTVSLEGWQKLRELYPNHSLTFAPEFLRAASAVKDFLATREIYMGGDAVGFWHAVFRVAFDDNKFTTQVALPEELILAKYFRNSFLATKVAFFNQVYDLCSATGIEYEMVRHVIATDSRIGDSHTTITPERGFGGHCFPKDTAAIVHTGKLVDVNLTLIEESIKYNKSVRKLS